MSGPIILLAAILISPVILIYMIRQRVRGKMLCYFIKKDRSVEASLCELRDDFVIWKNRAYDVYPDLVRLTKWPSGPMIPAFLQELVPTCLYLEEDAVPLDWVTLDKRLVRAMELKSALDENFFRKMIHETTYEEKSPFNWRKVLVWVLAVAGIGLLVLLFLKGCPKP